MKDEETVLPPTFQDAFPQVLEHTALIYEIHNPEKEDTWKDVPVVELEKMLQKEVKEYLETIGAEDMFSKSLNIVNFALMIATRRMVEVERP